MEVVLVRHGETEWSRDLRHTGRTDIPLTEAGRKQAAILRGTLGDWSFDRVLSSPLGRALETCRLAGLGERAECTDALLEWDYGDYEGITTAEIRTERPDWFLWRDGCPGGESAADVGARVDPLVEGLKAGEGTVALFAHGHLLRVLTARWLGLPPQDGALFALSTATLSVLGFERETAVITRWNAPAADVPSAIPQ
ncbi:MAG TPA: histidine phosphatase family protein [Thermoleophilaceae bacterium]|nr:histidine phosphatase family protein [Thermoleophilaceae bacterium]